MTRSTIKGPQDGAITFNEGSADVDFRVESNGNANMLVVDAGNDRVGIGTNTPDFPLDIEGSVADDAVSTVVRISADDPATSDDHAELQIKCGNGASSTATRRVELHALSNNGSDNRNLCLNPSGGNVLIGKTTTSGAGVQLEPSGTANLERSGDICMVLNRTTNAGEIVSIRQAGSAVGGIDANSSSVDFNTSSDYRLKENVTTSWDATTRLKQLKPVRFSWKVDSKSEADTDGFLAHEVSSVVPEATSGEKDAVDADGNPKHQGIDHSKLVALLTKALQEAISEIDILKAKVTALENNK